MFSDRIRRMGFWSLDFLRGGTVHKNYKQIKACMENGNLNYEQRRKLLSHAVSTTTFYKNCTSRNIKSFPIISKKEIKDNWDDIYSIEYKGKPIHHMSTSGSTGTPFVMDWDMGKRKRQLAELIYFDELASQKLGQSYIYFRVWTEKNRKSRLEQFMQNLTPINILHLDDNTLENIRRRLKRKPYINLCLAYASTYEYLVKYLSAMGDTPDMFHTSAFISGSEVLSMAMKKQIKETVGCKVIDRYSNEENGFIAQTGDTSDVFNVNTSGFYVEVLKPDNDEPCKIGELGRIVVTDLYNFAVPLIRYDTGDIAIKESEKDGWTTALKTIQGRKVDVIYDTKGSRLTPHTWSVYMWKFNKLKQYQFIQNDAREYTLRVNGAKGVYKDEDLVSHLKSVLGNDADITIEHVEGIPALASGKFKKTVCNYQYNIQDYTQ